MARVVLRVVGARDRIEPRVPAVAPHVLDRLDTPVERTLGPLLRLGDAQDGFRIRSSWTK